MAALLQVPAVPRGVNGRTARIVPLILGATLAIATVTALAAGRVALQFASGIDLVDVYATVTDAGGQLVTGLDVRDFQVSEDGRPQTVATFAAGELPLAVAVCLDRSFSMTAERLSIAKSGARALVDALRPSDQVMVVAIGSDAVTVAGLSSDHGVARAAIEGVDRWGTTPLYDGTLVALDAIGPARGRRALVLLSDGDDRGSRVSAADLVEQVRRKDVLVYPVAIGPRRVPLFAELAAVTGGHAMSVRDTRQATSALTAIARELRFQYLLGYTPNLSRLDGPRWRSIQVSVRRSGLHVRARDGYESR